MKNKCLTGIFSPVGEKIYEELVIHYKTNESVCLCTPRKTRQNLVNGEQFSELTTST